MPQDPFSDSAHQNDVLDERVIAKRRPTSPPWQLSILIVLIFTFSSWQLWANIGSETMVDFFSGAITIWDLFPSAWELLFLGLFVLGTSSTVLLALNKQLGWVLGMIYSAYIFVGTFIGFGDIVFDMVFPGRFLSQLINWPYIAPFLLVAIGLIYLVTCTPVRTYLRIPRSWIGRGMTFGGLAGAVHGVLLIIDVS
jgi:hypothetical protein